MSLLLRGYSEQADGFGPWKRTGFLESSLLMPLPESLVMFSSRCGFTPVVHPPLDLTNGHIFSCCVPFSLSSPRPLQLIIHLQLSFGPLGCQSFCDYLVLHVFDFSLWLAYLICICLHCMSLNHTGNGRVCQGHLSRSHRSINKSA